MPAARYRPLKAEWDERINPAAHAASIMAALAGSALPPSLGQHNRAACRDHDPEMWHVNPRRLDAVDRAKAICAPCPIKAQCLSLGDGLDGIWGGMTKAERESRTFAA